MGGSASASVLPEVSALSITDTLSELLCANMRKSPGKTATLSMILLEEPLRLCFMKYLAYEIAQENLMFYEEFEMLKLMHKVDRSDSLFFDAFTSILRRYVDIDSEFEINIPAVSRELLLTFEERRIKKTGTVDRLAVIRELQKAQREVFGIMVGCLQRFLKSKILKDFRSNACTVERLQAPGRKKAKVVKRTLLLIEQDPLLLALLEKIMEDREYTVISTDSATKGITMLCSTRVDVVLTSLDIQGEKPILIINSFRRKESSNYEKSIPNFVHPFIIGTTLNGSLAAEAMAAGFDGVMLKPFRMCDFHRLRPHDCLTLKAVESSSDGGGVVSIDGVETHTPLHCPGKIVINTRIIGGMLF